MGAGRTLPSLGAVYFGSEADGPPRSSTPGVNDDMRTGMRFHAPVAIHCPMGLACQTPRPLLVRPAERHEAGDGWRVPFPRNE